MRTKAGLFAVVAALAAFAAPSASASNPTAVGAATPSTVAPGQSTVLTVAVTPGADPASTGVFVSCNLFSIGGAFNQMLTDDGTGGDLVAGDLVFSYRAVVSPAAAPGQRSLPCVVSDAQGRTSLPQIALLVDASANQPPTVSGGGPYALAEGSTVTLAATGSDPEGGPLTFAWDMDGNGLFESPGQSVSFGADDGPATRTVAVQATDDHGQNAVALATVVVSNVAPTATFDTPGSVSASSFTLALTSPHDPSVSDTAAGFAYAFDCGAGYAAYGVAATATCPAGHGEVAVGARIRDKDGGVTEYRSTVDVHTTYDSLCELTRSLSRKPHVADSLCKKLDKAEHARTARQRRHHLRAYRREVHAQTGRRRSKAFSPHDGALLESLALELERG